MAARIQLAGYALPYGKSTGWHLLSLQHIEVILAEFFLQTVCILIIIIIIQEF
jgi:uncharacterized membrane protein YqjE